MYSKHVVQVASSIQIVSSIRCLGFDLAFRSGSIRQYITKQQARDELIKRLHTGSEKYNEEDQHAEFTIIGYGDATFSSSMRGSPGAPTKGIIKKLEEFCKRIGTDKIRIFMIDKYLTKQRPKTTNFPQN